MKEAGTEHWLSPNTGATNESGFSALPGGDNYVIWEIDNIGEGAYFHTIADPGPSGPYGPGYYGARLLGFDSSTLFDGWSYINQGHSVRCIKD